MRVEIDGYRYVPESKDSDNQELNALRQEREDVIKMLRVVCAKAGDNDWPDNLHLLDVLEKHLLDYFDFSDGDTDEDDKTGWSTQSPNEPGYYWIRNYRIERDSGVNEKPVVVHLHSSFGEPFEVTFTGNDSSFSIGEVVEGQWAGPVMPPEY